MKDTDTRKYTCLLCLLWPSSSLSFSAFMTYYIHPRLLVCRFHITLHPRRLECRSPLNKLHLTIVEFVSLGVEVEGGTEKDV